MTVSSARVRATPLLWHLEINLFAPRIGARPTPSRAASGLALVGCRKLAITSSPRQWRGPWIWVGKTAAYSSLALGGVIVAAVLVKPPLEGVDEGDTTCSRRCCSFMT